VYPKVSGLGHNDLIKNSSSKHSLRNNTKGYGGKPYWTDSQNSDATAPYGRELYHLQSSLHGGLSGNFWIFPRMFFLLHLINCAFAHVLPQTFLSLAGKSVVLLKETNLNILSQSFSTCLFITFMAMIHYAVCSVSEVQSILLLFLSVALHAAKFWKRVYDAASSGLMPMKTVI